MISLFLIRIKSDCEIYFHERYKLILCHCERSKFKKYMERKSIFWEIYILSEAISDKIQLIEILKK